MDGVLPRREGDRLIVPLNTELPKYCVKCGAEAGYPITRKLSWVSRWFLLLAILGVIFYVIAASLAARRATVRLWLCDDHKRAYDRDRMIGWAGLGLTVLAFVALIFGGAIVPRDWLGALAIAETVALLLGSIVGLYGYYRTRLLGAARIDNTSASLKGFGRGFLRSPAVN